MTDATRRTRLEWETHQRYSPEGNPEDRYYTAKVGAFSLLVVIDAMAPGDDPWLWEICGDLESGYSATEIEAMLAAESWLAEAVREPAERLGGGGGEREEIR